MNDKDQQLGQAFSKGFQKMAEKPDLSEEEDVYSGDDADHRMSGWEIDWNIMQSVENNRL